MAGLSIDSKRDTHTIRWIAVVAVLVICTVIGIQLVGWYTTGAKPPIVPLPASAYADSTIDETPVESGQVNSYTVSADHPRYISIPALDITNARVMKVGLTEKGLLRSPEFLDDAGWYEKSANPGQGYGAVLITGHNNGVSRKGAFAGLDKLRGGNTIIVERGDGKRITYSVIESKTEEVKQAFETGLKRLLTPYDTSKEGLGLITDAGKWIPRDKVYDKRILIRAIAKDTTSETVKN